MHNSSFLGLKALRLLQYNTEYNNNLPKKNGVEIEEYQRERKEEKEE